jgi:hypothetical protein
MSKAKVIRTRVPHISKNMLAIARVVGRLYLISFIGAARISVQGIQYMVESFRRSLNKESRSLLVYRHQNGAEPQILGWFILFKLKKYALKARVSFALKPHIIFVHGYEVLRWGGPLARTVLPRLGAVPIYHAKIDSKSMKTLYRTVFDGPYPLTIAPEGQVSYFTDYIPRLESGPVRIAFQAAERLDCPVELLPVSIFMHYNRRGEKQMWRILQKIERCIGIKSEENQPFEERVRRCRDSILEINEQRYHISHEEGASFEARAGVVMEAALTACESILGIQEKGESFSRMHALRQRCWDAMFPDSLNYIPIKRAIADIQAGTAWYASRHLELFDILYYFCVPVPDCDAPLRARIEYVQELYDFVNRTMGGAFKDRITIKPTRVVISTEKPINITEYLEDYHSNHKKTIADINQKLNEAYRHIH